MTSLTAFVTAMIALSMGVERIVEILKGAFGSLKGHDTVIHLLAAVSGFAISMAIGPHQLFPLIPDGGFDSSYRWTGSLLLGLMASGGSAFWNQILDILTAVKTVRETAAQTQALPNSNRIQAKIMANIALDYTQPFQVRFVANLPLAWQVIRVRAGAETVVSNGSTAAQPPPPPDTAQVAAGQFAAGDTLRWAADLNAPPNAAANYKLDVYIEQSGQTIEHDGPRQGNIAANGDKIETGDYTCV